MIIVFIIGERFINFFSTKKITNLIRLMDREEHLIKNRTPTMGGVLILIGLFAEFFYGQIYLTHTIGC